MSGPISETTTLTPSIKESIGTAFTKLPCANYRNAGVLLHGTLTNNAAHIIIPTLSASAFDALSDADLRSFFESYSGVTGIILDLRHNNGGSEIHARRIAAFFHQTTTLYGYTRTRLDPDNLSRLNPKHVTPHPDLRLTAPVVVLVGKVCLSSAEWLALMMREAPNAILTGDQTRGGSGNPAQRSIPELGVNYLISQWVAYDTEQSVFEDRGISPAIHMAPESSFDDASQRDYLLEHAMEYINWRHSDGGAHQPVNRLTDLDGDTVMDVDEFVGGSSRLDPASFFRIDVTREPPYKMSWSALARRSYAVETRSHFGEPWRALSHDPVPNSPGTAEQLLPNTSPAFYRLLPPARRPRALSLALAVIIISLFP